MVNPRSPLVCVGHSHIETVVVAAAKASVPLEAFNFWRRPFRAGVHDEVVQFVREFCCEPLPAPVFSFVGGGAHMDFGMVVHQRPYDFVLPDVPHLPMADGAEAVPYDALHASMQAHVRSYMEIMGTVRSATEGRVFHIEAPPPRETEVVATQDPGWSDFFGKDSVIAPAWLRYKLWRLHSKIISTYCSEAGIVFVRHPRQATDAHGFLAPAYCGSPGHANQDYGALILRQMRDLSGGEPEPRGAASSPP